MSTRREAREMALKIMYSMTLNESYSKQWQHLANDAYVLKQEYELERDGYSVDNLAENLPPYQPNDLLRLLIIYTIDHLSEIDEMIARFTEHWDIERINIIDRNILRLGIAELQYCQGIPSRVSINEWIEIAKFYSTDDSPKFVNGILDRVANAQGDK